MLTTALMIGLTVAQGLPKESCASLDLYDEPTATQVAMLEASSSVIESEHGRLISGKESLRITEGLDRLTHHIKSASQGKLVGAVMFSKEIKIVEDARYVCVTVESHIPKNISKLYR